MSEAISGAFLLIPHIAALMRATANTSTGRLPEICFVLAGIACPIVRQQALPDITMKR